MSSRSTSFFEAHARRMDGGGLSPPLLRAESLAESLAERIAILDARSAGAPNVNTPNMSNFLCFVTGVRTWARKRQLAASLTDALIATRARTG